MFCHPEHIRSAQCKLREGSLPMGTEMLLLRCAQGFGSHAQHDSTDFGRYSSFSLVLRGMLARLVKIGL